MTRQGRLWGRKCAKHHISICALLIAIACLLPVTAFAQSTGDGIWVKDAKGEARHVQSGIACPPSLPTITHAGSKVGLARVALKDVIIGSDRQPAGDQVGCEYEGYDGSWASVEITKLRPNETVASQATALRERIKVRFPTALREFDASGIKPRSPTGGGTFSAGYYNIKIRDRRASVAVAGGEVAGWMVIVVQCDHAENATGLQVVAVTSWISIVDSRSIR